MSRTSDIIADLRSSDAEYASLVAAEGAVRDESRTEYLKRAKRTGRYSAVSGERTALPLAARQEMERRGTRILRAAGEATGSELEGSNDAYRTRRLPRMAQGMARKHGRSGNENVAQQFVASFSSQWSAVERLLIGFLPEKVAHKDGQEIVERLAVERRFTFDPADKADMAAFRAMMREVNPASGHAGGRPRKVREVAGCVPQYRAKGALYGTYEPGLIGMQVGGLVQKVDGCTCAGLSGSGYRGCAGHGYRGVGHDAPRPFVGRMRADGTVVHVGDLAQEDEQ